MRIESIIEGQDVETEENKKKVFESRDLAKVTTDVHSEKTPHTFLRL